MSSRALTLHYSLFPLEYIANPIVPNARPATEAPQEKKFKKKVDSSTLMTIKKGKAMPKSIRITPRIRNRRGEFIIFIRYGTEGVFWCSCGALSYNQHATK